MELIARLRSARRLEIVEFISDDTLPKKERCIRTARALCQPPAVDLVIAFIDHESNKVTMDVKDALGERIFVLALWGGKQADIPEEYVRLTESPERAYHPSPAVRAGLTAPEPLLTDLSFIVYTDVADAFRKVTEYIEETF